MATKKRGSKKGNRKREPLVADSPVTVGGGGGSAKLALPMVIRFIPGDWTYDASAGTLTLANGNCKKVKVSTDDIEIRVPLTGAVSVDLKIVKP